MKEVRIWRSLILLTINLNLVNSRVHHSRDLPGIMWRVLILLLLVCNVYSRSLSLLPVKDAIGAPKTDEHKYIMIKSAWEEDSPLWDTSEMCPEGYKRDTIGICREVWYDD